MKADRFLATHSVFTRAELQANLAGRAPSTVDAHIARWTRQGRVAPIKRGLYLRAEGASGEGASPPDLYLVASKMAPDAVLAYHSALEVLGYAQSLFEKITYATWTKTRPLSFQGRRFTPVRPRAPLRKAGGGEKWIERRDRAEGEIRVTSLERTVADLLDRPAIAGGLEEVWRSLQSIPALDPAALEEYVETLRSRTLAAKVGFYLESRGEELLVPDSTIVLLRSRAPEGPVYMDRRRKGRLVSRWGLVVPADLLSSGESEPR